MQNIFEASQLNNHNLDKILFHLCKYHDYYHDLINEFKKLSKIDCTNDDSSYSLFESILCYKDDKIKTDDLRDAVGSSIISIYSHIANCIPDDISSTSTLNINSFLKNYISNTYEQDKIFGTRKRFIIYDTLMNIYVLHKYKTSEKISLTKLMEQCDNLQNNNMEYPYIMTFKSSKLSTRLAKSNFWIKHPYAHCMGVNEGLDNEGKHVKHSFCDCFHWFQIFLLHSSKYCPLIIPDRKKPSAMAVHSLPIRHLLSETDYNKLDNHADTISFSLDTVKKLIDNFNDKLKKYTSKFSNSNITKQTHYYLTRKILGYEHLDKIFSLFNNDYLTLTELNNCLDKDLNDDDSVRKLYNQYHNLFYNNINCLMQLTYTPYVLSRYALFDYTSIIINNITPSDFNLLPNNIIKPTPLYFVAYSLFQSNNITNNTSFSYITEYEDILKRTNTIINKINNVFLPLFVEFTYKLIHDIFIYHTDGDENKANTLMETMLEDIIESFDLPDTLFNMPATTLSEPKLNEDFYTTLYQSYINTNIKRFTTKEHNILSEENVFNTNNHNIQYIYNKICLWHHNTKFDDNYIDYSSLLDELLDTDIDADDNYINYSLLLDELLDIDIDNDMPDNYINYVSFLDDLPDIDIDALEKKNSKTHETNTPNTEYPNRDQLDNHS